MGSKAENIPLDILFEDEQLIAVNKPAGMVVHPAKGHWSGTLTAALSYHFENLSQVGGAERPGIVHRLDRDTTGVMLVAKTDQAHVKLNYQFEKRTVVKTYLAIVSPAPDRDRDWIRQPIGVHPYQREKMAIREGHPTSRAAETFFEVQERFTGFALVKAFPKTGRTHQIRLHLAHIGCPVLCDRLYSGRSKLETGKLDPNLPNQILLTRQALHAESICFKHPVSGQRMSIEAPLPADVSTTLDFLRQHRTIDR
jgi:23S rRNA pseudouridine1911/1915/1917 synthase